MKVLHINCSDKGSTGKIIEEISTVGGEQGYISVLCNPKKRSNRDEYGLKKYRTSLPKEQSIYKHICYYLGYQYGFAPLSTYKIIRTIKLERPDIIHIHSINCYMVNIYILFSFLKENKYPTLITNHAEFFYTGNCFHAKNCTRYLNGCGECPNLFFATRSKLKDKSHEAWLKMYNSIQGIDNISVVSVSPWVLNRSSISPIMQGIHQSEILNGVNTNVFNIGKRKFVSKNILLFVTANFNVNDYSEKGGGFIIDLAQKMQLEKVRIIVVGKIQGDVAVPENVELIGRIDNQSRLADFYRMASLTVVTSKRETFSMPVAESLCCGTPVVGFEAGGPESIADLRYSEFVEYGDLDKLERIITDKWLKYKTAENNSVISHGSIKKYNSDRMVREYITAYEELINEKDRNIDIS